MSGSKLLLDSNIIIYLSNKVLLPESFIGENDIVYISDISLMETLGYSFANEHDKKSAEELVSIFLRLPIDDSVIQKVIEIRKQKKVKLPDAIIAATCIVHSCQLITRNVADFSGINDLVVHNPFVS